MAKLILDPWLLLQGENVPGVGADVLVRLLLVATGKVPLLTPVATGLPSVEIPTTELLRLRTVEPLSTGAEA